MVQVIVGEIMNQFKIQNSKLNTATHFLVGFPPTLGDKDFFAHESASGMKCGARF
ncbi:hypothetical protein GXM_01978 [Nostoc sphaeroides CCNUC1]|uniref:Uncharacterized protein n=1 Tax=Nostoc sphaeroides CCNUC1 TaxID=2653204 RepID=A0A5P8VVQ6_9NOSO|nr:hypothetical protein GXM_01978 [Nostoc sphaeroides CCNUC1]